MPKIYITKRATFEAAHHLEGHSGKCARIHGHSYKVEVTACKRVTDCVEDCNNLNRAMVMDFSKLKEAIDGVIVSKYDHEDLNKFFSAPTAEVMCQEFFRQLNAYLFHLDIRVSCVKLWETEDSYATYTE